MLPTTKEQIIKEEIVKESELEYSVNFWYTLDGLDIIKKTSKTISQEEARLHLEEFKQKFEEVIKESTMAPTMVETMPTKAEIETVVSKEVAQLREELEIYKENEKRMASLYELTMLEKKLDKLLKKVNKSSRRISILWFFLVTLPILLVVGFVIITKVLPMLGIAY